MGRRGGPGGHPSARRACSTRHAPHGSNASSGIRAHSPRFGCRSGQRLAMYASSSLSGIARLELFIRTKNTRGSCSSSPTSVVTRARRRAGRSRRLRPHDSCNPLWLESSPRPRARDDGLPRGRPTCLSSSRPTESVPPRNSTGRGARRWDAPAELDGACAPCD